MLKITNMQARRAKLLVSSLNNSSRRSFAKCLSWKHIPDFRGHSLGHSPGHFGPEGPEASCRGLGMSQDAVVILLSAGSFGWEVDDHATGSTRQDSVEGWAGKESGLPNREQPIQGSSTPISCR